MGKTATIKKAPVKKATAKHALQGSFVMNTAIRFAEKREGRIVGRVQGKRFKTYLNAGPLKLDEWASVVYVTPEVLEAGIKQDLSFDELRSDRMEVIVFVMNRGKEVFGDQKKFRRWLDAPRPVLGGRKPIDMLNDLAGIGEVLTELGRIEHGVF